MHISISSFSYKSGLPSEFSSWSDDTHGGGFVFDCRCLPNPGREERFKALTGLDEEVMSYLENHSSVSEFLDSCKVLTVMSITNYLERGFKFLKISFGCTGGQHRSVYCSEKLAHQLRLYFAERITVSVDHLELVRKGMLK